MKTLEELQKEYVEAEATLNAAKDAYFDKVVEIKKAVVQYAKFKVGDKINHVFKGWRENDPFTRKPGIIREVIAGSDYGNEPIAPRYIVGKITKSGAIHGSQNINYSSIAESDIELFGTTDSAK